MSQESLDFGRLYRVDDGARRVYRFLQDAVDIVGVLPAAGACGIDRSDLRRGLDRDGRRVAIEHALAIGAMVAPTNPELAEKIGDTLKNTIAPPLPPMDDKEARIRLEAALRALGPIGEQAMFAALGGRR